VKRDMFDVLQATDIGMSVTESLAMLPAASVSGFYLAHPDSTYFSVGKIGQDQLEDYAKRMSLSKTDAERALAPLL
jgi:5-methyltetrahydrofolate--homocysteine methyltransferase